MEDFTTKEEKTEKAGIKIRVEEPWNDTEQAPKEKSLFSGGESEILEEEETAENASEPEKHPGRVWNLITKWALCLLVFLTPLFFLPMGIVQVAYNKSFMALVLISIALIAWLAKAIASGKIVWVRSPLNIVVWVFLIVAGLSTYFSIARTASLGFLSSEADSFLDLAKYALAFFLVAATFYTRTAPASEIEETSGKSFWGKIKKFFMVEPTIEYLFVSFLASEAVLALITGLKFLKLNPFPWDFAKTIDFNSVGTINGLSLFLGFGLVILVGLFVSRQPKSVEGLNNGSQSFEEKAEEKDEKFTQFNYDIFRFVLPILAIVLAVELVLINFMPLWWSLAGAMLFLVAYGLTKEVYRMRKGGQKVFAMQKIALPIIVLVAAIVIILANYFSSGLAVSKLISLPAEVSPSQKATYDISKQVLTSHGLKTILFGSGPTTFTYDYGLFRQPVNNQSQVERLFWGVRFTQGSSAISTSLSTFGVLGFLAFIALLLAFAWQTLKNLSFKSRDFLQEKISGNGTGFSLLSANLNDLQTAVICALIFLFISWFLYPINFTLTMLAFVCLGLLVAFVHSPETKSGEGMILGSFSENEAGEEKGKGYLAKIFSVFNWQGNNKAQIREISLLVSPQRTLIVSLILIALMIGSISLFYLGSQKYIASIYFAQGLAEYNKTGDPDSALNEISKAINLDPAVDQYWRSASQAFLMKTNKVLNSPDWQKASGAALEDLKSQFQVNMSQAISFGKSATEKNPVESLNWTNLGYVYESILPFASGGESFMIDAYQKAHESEPANPALVNDLGRAHLTISDKAQLEINQIAASQNPDQAQITALTQLKNQELEEAIKNLEKAISLKPDYSPAHYLLVQAYSRQGDLKNAIARSSDYYVLNSQDPGAAFQLGFLFYKDNQIANAKAALERAVELSSDYSNARYFLGLIYDNEGNKQAAKEQFEKIAALNPDNQEVKKILDNLNNGRAALETISPPAPAPQNRTEPPVPDKGGASGQGIKP